MRAISKLAIGLAIVVGGTGAVAPSSMAAPPSSCSSNPVPSKVRTNSALAIPLVLMCQSGGASPVSVSIVTPPAHGELSGPLESPVYTPSPGFTGSDGLTFRVTNPDGTSGDLTWSFDVADGSGYAPQCAGSGPPYVRNDAPVAINLTCSDQSLDEARVVVVTPPQHGTLSTIQQGAFEPVAVSLMPNHFGSTAAVTYTADAGYTGTDSFKIAGDDGHLVGTAQSVMLNVTDGAVNHAPVCSAASNQTVAADATSLLMAGCADPDGDSFTMTTTQPPSHGTIGSWERNPWFGYQATYTPQLGFTGADAMTMQATDSRGASSSAVPMGVTVQNGPLPTTILCAARMLGVTRNVSLTTKSVPCFTQTGMTASTSISTAPSHGTASILPSGELRYVPDRNFIGPDTLTLHATAGSASLDAVVVVSVSSRAKTTILSGPAATSAETTQAFSLYGESGVALTCALSGSPDSAPVPCTGTKTYTDTPAGDHVFSVTATDDKGRTSTDTYAFTVTGTTPPASAGGGASGGSGGGSSAPGSAKSDPATAPSETPADAPTPAAAPPRSAPLPAAPDDPLTTLVTTRLPLASLLRSGRATVTFVAPAAGKLSARWTIADRRGVSGRTTLAIGTARASRSGAVKMTVRLTRAGRKLLGRERGAVKVSATATFRPDGAAATTRSATVSLRWA